MPASRAFVTVQIRSLDMVQLIGSRVRIAALSVFVVLLCAVGPAQADFTFGEPVNLGPRVNSSAHDGGLVSGDGLSIFFDSNRFGGHGDWDIWTTTRETEDGLWGIPVNLGSPVNTSVWDGVPSVSSDGLTLFLSSNRSGGSGDFDLWMTTRETKEHPWATPVNLGPTVNSPSTDWSPYISPDGLELYFGSTRAGGWGDYDLWMTTRTTPEADWGPPVNLGLGINSSAAEFTPSISAHGLRLFFCSLRPGGYGNRDIWVATRATKDADWGTPMNLGPPLNSPSMDQTASPSADGSSIFFLSNRPGGYGGLDFMQVSVSPVVDFTGDYKVDIDDLIILIEYWGMDESLCDIGPTPWGDGIVDEQDLEVLMSYWDQELDDPNFIAHWKLDEAADMFATDSVGGHKGLAMGAPVWQPDGGQVDGALEFDGVDDHVITDLVLNPADGTFSVLMWIKGGAPGQVIISQTDGVNWLMVDAVEGTLTTELSPLATRTPVPPLVSEALIADDDWHRVAFVWDGFTRSLHMDGTLVAEDEQGSLAEYGGTLNIGCGPAHEQSTLFSGLIDDVRIYNRAVRP